MYSSPAHPSGMFSNHVPRYEEEAGPGDPESDELEMDARPGDSEYIPASSPEEYEIYPNPHITPTKRAMGSDGKGIRDAKAKQRVIASLKKHKLNTGRCALTNASDIAVPIEYAHLLPLATTENIVNF